MSFAKGHVPSHKGRRVTADPLKNSETVSKVKELLHDKPRDLALWVLATNSMLRAGDLVSLTWDNTIDDGERITISLQQGKTKKPTTIPLAAEASAILRRWRVLCTSPFIFSGQRGQLTIAAWSRMVKHWCHQIGLEGNFSSHTTRKTGVRVRYDEHGTKLATLMHMLSHSSEAQTLIYMGKMTEEVEEAFSTSL